MEENLLWDFETCRKKIAKSEQGMRWLVRQRAIDGMVRIGRRIYFIPDEVRKWVLKNQIKTNKVGQG